MSKAVRQQQAYLREQNKLWPSTMVQVPRSEWPTYFGQKVMPFSVWRSSKFLAQVFEPVCGATRISVQRSMVDHEGNWIQGIVWDELMAIKSQVGFENCWAVEIYPPVEDIVNVANMRHLFVIAEAPEFAWRAKR